MYCLLRHYDLNRWSALLGGLLFSFSGYLLSVYNMNTSLAAAVWLPLAVLFFDRWMNGGKFSNLAGLAVSLVLTFLGGEPTIIYMTILLLFAYAVVFSQTRRQGFINLSGLALACAMAAGLAAAQLLPFIELARLSDRTGKIAYDLATFRSFPPRELINFIFPYFFGNAAQFGNLTENLIGKNFQDWLISPYLGILPLLFAALAFSRRRRLAWFWLGTAVVGLFLAFGCYTPFYHLAYLLPGISMIRYPVKYLFLVNFSLVWLAAAGFDNLSRQLRNDSKQLARMCRWLLNAAFCLALAAAAANICKARIIQLLVGHYPAQAAQYFIVLLRNLVDFNLFSLTLVSANLFGFAVLLRWASQKKIHPNIFAGLICLLIAVDLFANSMTIMVPINAKLFTALPATYRRMIEQPTRGRFFYMPAVEQQNRMTFGENYDEAMWEAKENFTANWPLPHHLADFYGYESIKPRALMDYYRKEFGGGQKMTSQKLNQLSAYNVKFIISAVPLNFPQLKIINGRFKFGRNFYLYENNGVLPLAYMIFHGRTARMSRQTILDLKTAQILKYEPDEVVIKVETKKAGQLFLSDSYYPGWRAWVDDQPVKIEKSQGLFRIVPVPMGEHLVRFHYEPRSFYLGGIISLLTLGLILVGAVVLRYY